jgi:peptide/nickel transport system substrate-binding protein
MNARLVCALAWCAMLVLGSGCARERGFERIGGRNAWTIPGVVRLGEPDEPDTLNPLFAHTAAADQTAALLYSYLLRYDANGNLIPDLATAVPSVRDGGISADGRTYTLHLRHDARWADGTPVTANDWLFTYHAVMDPQSAVGSREGWDDIAWARAPDPYTLVIRLKRPNAAFLGVLAMGGNAYPPLPAHLLAHVRDLRHAAFNDDPLSDGPFELRAWRHGSSLTFVPNPFYFRGKPPLREIRWVVIPDTASLLNALRAHEIDVDGDIAPATIMSLRAIRGIRVVHRIVANERILGFDCARPPLNDVRLRLAIAEGIDWARLLHVVYDDRELPATSDIYPLSWAAPHVPPYPYDPQHARALLDAAGWHLVSDGFRSKAGRPLRLTLISATDVPDDERAEVQIQAMLRRIGIRIEIRNYPANLLFAQNGPIYTGRYDLEWSVNTQAPDPDNSGSWVSAFIPPNGANTAWLRDAEVDRLAEAALATADRRRRAALYRQEELRLHALVPTVFVYWEDKYEAINRDLHGFRPAAYLTDTWNAWEWRI